MDLGYGFVSGLNKVSKQKVCYWLHTNESISWDAFIWYIADYCDIYDYAEDYFIVRIMSEKQREYFYKKVIEYDDISGTNNFEIDCKNELWREHKRGVERNEDILIRLINK